MRRTEISFHLCSRVGRTVVYVTRVRRALACAFAGTRRAVRKQSVRQHRACHEPASGQRYSPGRAQASVLPFGVVISATSWARLSAESSACAVVKML